MLVDADTGQKRPPFDHEKLAARSEDDAPEVTAVTLPFNPSPSKTTSARRSALRRGDVDVLAGGLRLHETASRRPVEHGSRPPPARRPPPTRSPGCRPTANGKRSSPTSTSPSARRAPRRSRCSAPTARRATATNSTRSRGRPIRRSSRRTASGRDIAASCITSSPRPRISCSRSIDALLRQARRRARPRAAGHLRHREQAGAGHRQRALPQPLRSLAARVAQGQLRAHLRVQPARPPGVQHHRGECRDRRRAGRHLGGAEDVLHLFGQEVPARRRPTAARSSGCRSGTAGTTCISSTA